MSRPILVSACLLGLNTRYNLVPKRNDRLLELLARLDLSPVPVCPEQLAGLPTPRPATRFARGDGAAVLRGDGIVVNSHGDDVSRLFVAGAEQALQVAGLAVCEIAVLKERSPSCGVQQIHLDQQIVAGSGVACALLRQAGVAVFSEEQLEALEAFLTSTPLPDESCHD